MSTTTGYTVENSASSARVTDANGWVEIKNNPISRVGVFPYTGASIDSSGKLGLQPDKLYNVYRSASELSSPETVDSFRLVPWIDTHTMLASTVEPQDKLQVHGVIGEDVRFENGVLFGNLKSFDKNYLKNVIDTGEKREVSCGFACKYVPQQGTFGDKQYDFLQRDIRGNHLASVSSGRMGATVAVLDGADFNTGELSFVFDYSEAAKMGNLNSSGGSEEKTESEDKLAGEEKTRVVAQKSAGDESGLSVENLAALISDIVPKIEQIQQAVSALRGGGGETTQGAETETETQYDKQDPLKGEDTSDKGLLLRDSLADTKKKSQTGMDSLEKLKNDFNSYRRDGVKTLMKEISGRDKLYNDVSPIIGSFDHAEMTTSDVAQYACKRLSLAGGDETALLRGFLQAKKSTRAQQKTYAADSATVSSVVNPIEQLLAGK